MLSDHKTLRITTLGGGSGQPQLLRALAQYPEYALTGIVTTMDSGGSSGVLREEYGMVPPGDIRRTLSALVSDESVDSWWNYRMHGGSLRDHTIGNLVLAGLVEKYGTMSAAVAQLEDTLPMRGRVLPVSDSAGVLCAELVDGSVLRGEHVIDVPVGARAPIAKVFLEESIPLLPQAREAILNSDYIFLSCGDVYTSVIPNLLVPGVPQAIAESKAPVVLICNRTTKKGETDGWSYGDVYTAASSYLSPARISIVLCDAQVVPVPITHEAFRLANLDSGVTMIQNNFADDIHPERISLTKVAAAFSDYARLH